MSDGTVLSEAFAWDHCDRCGKRPVDRDTGQPCSHPMVRAVERAVLEALPDAATEAQANADLCARLMALEGDNEALRARVAELERERDGWQREAESMRDELARRRELGLNPWYWMGDGTDDLESLSCPVCILPDELRAIIAERDTALRELEEAREDTARLDWLGAPDDVGGRWARVWRTWNGEEPLRAALDRARAGGFIK